MTDIQMMIREVQQAIENTCDCSDGSCSTCYAVALLYKAHEQLTSEISE